MKNNLLALVGAVVGAAVGYVLCKWMMRHGFYALVLPGGFVGLGAGVFKCRSMAVPIACGAIGLVAAILTDWHLEPFIADNSMGYFLAHLGELQPVTLAMMTIGTVVAFWVPFRRLGN